MSIFNKEITSGQHYIAEQGLFFFDLLPSVSMAWRMQFLVAELNYCVKYKQHKTE